MKIYITQYNSDMTEGRGPMANGPAFLSLKDANDFIDDQPGVMGRRSKWSKEKYGDWCVIELEVHEGPFDKLAAAKKKALTKLTEEDRRALGL